MADVSFPLCFRTVFSLSYQLLTSHNSLLKDNIEVMLRAMVSRPVCLWPQDQIFVTARPSRVYWFGVSSLTRERVCSLQLLLVLANKIILMSHFRWTHDHILLSQIRDYSNWKARSQYVYPPGTLPLAGLRTRLLSSLVQSSRFLLVLAHWITSRRCIAPAWAGQKTSLPLLHVLFLPGK
jgi:hypothetical protein